MTSDLIPRRRVKILDDPRPYLRAELLEPGREGGHSVIRSTRPGNVAFIA